MKILVSDYDGTIKTYDKDPNFIERHTFKKNIESIKNFRQKGNLFIISTGRATNSIIKEINKYNIEYDYLTSYDGRVTFDNKQRLVFAKYLELDFLNKLRIILDDNMLTKDFALYNEFSITNNYTNIITIMLKPNRHSNIIEILSNINDYFPEVSIKVTCFHGKIIINIDYNKALGIRDLLTIEQIDVNHNNIFTVGDSMNDQEMLDYYNSHKVFISDPRLESDKITTSVHRLIKKINNI